LWLSISQRGAGGRRGGFPGSAPRKDLISTLLFTVVVETLVVISYCIWRKKPMRSILITSFTVNLFTQFSLWAALNLFFRHYLVTLWIAETLIWIGEGLALYFIPANRLRLKEALFLSFGMNLLSFTLGWFLPI
jgi:hypothetical protein